MSERKPVSLLGCVFAGIVLLASPFITIAVSALDAWAITTVLGWTSAWTLTFAEAFALSLLSGMLCHQHIKREGNEIWAAFAVSIVTPPIVVGVVALARAMGWL